MIRITALATGILLLAASYALAQSPIPITACGNITAHGNYVLASNLVASYGDDCLIISSSHINIDMNGWAITAACPPSNPDCPPFELGGTAVQITSGADHVSISNLAVQSYSSGIVVAADYASVVGASLNAFAGITLNNVNYARFTGVSYTPANETYNGTNGPILSISGGSHNTVRFKPTTINPNATQGHRHEFQQ